MVRAIQPSGHPLHSKSCLRRSPVCFTIRSSVDAMLVYVSIAQQLGLLYIQLPEAIDLSSPTLADRYRAARYTNPLGQTFFGTPAVYSITILANATNPTAAEAFVATVLSDAGRAAFAQHGFVPAPILVGGAATAMPQALQPLIQGTYPE